VEFVFLHSTIRSLQPAALRSINGVVSAEKAITFSLPLIVLLLENVKKMQNLDPKIPYFVVEFLRQ